MNLIRKVKKSVSYRNLGGSTFEIERTITVKEAKQLSGEGNWACFNYFERRPDMVSFETKELYYGHIGGLGYILSEDELQ